MESTESPLDVLSRAATMVQGNSLLPSYDEARSYSKCKELTVGPPSGGKWRRERRQKNTGIPPPDYSVYKQGSHPEPIDMSTRRMRGSPPSYSQSVCAAGYVRTGTRPSVITCTQPTVTPTGVLDKGGVCDPVIDEHFRRSLGKDYLSLYADNGHHEQSGKGNNVVKPDPDGITGSSLSVDDHFAKALGETWIKLQRGETMTPTEATSSDGDSNLLRHRSVR